MKTAVDVAQRAKRDAEKAQERMTDEMKEARLRVCTAEERIAVLSAIKPSEDVPAYLDRLHHQERLAFTLIYAE